jgi:hypothetical protein
MMEGITLYHPGELNLEDNFHFMSEGDVITKDRKMEV